jgi:acyl-CoA thioesterase I
MEKGQGLGARRTMRSGVAAALILALAACSDGASAPDDKGVGRAPAQEKAASAAAPAPIDANARLIVAFGDSLYAGYQLDQGEGFAPELERALTARGVDARVFNAGVSGDTTAAGLARLAFTLDGLPKKPDLVIVGLGGNDMLRGIDAAQTRQNLDAILAELDRRGIKAMLTGMLAPPNLGADYVRAFNGIYPDLARQHNAALYPFFLDGVIGQRDLFLPDGIHPTATGIDRIVARVAPVVVAALPPAA